MLECERRPRCQHAFRLSGHSSAVWVLLVLESGQEVCRVDVILHFAVSKQQILPGRNGMTKRESEFIPIYSRGQCTCTYVGGGVEDIGGIEGRGGDGVGTFSNRNVDYR